MYNHESDSIHDILSGMGNARDTERTSTPPSNYDRERKPSIDMFLSQSPSKALGEDSFLSMSASARRPSTGASNNQAGVFKPMSSSTAPSSRSESPVNSRSASVGGGNNNGYYSAAK